MEAREQFWKALAWENSAFEPYLECAPEDIDAELARLRNLVERQQESIDYLHEKLRHALGTMERLRYG